MRLFPHVCTAGMGMATTSELIDEEVVIELFERERQRRRPPIDVDDIPFTYEDITPAWLTAVLCRSAPGAEVVAYRLGPRDDGTSNRRRIHIKYNATEQHADLPETVFCKATQDLANRILIGRAGAAQAECDFYNLVRPQLDIEAPIACLASYNDEMNSIVMLRELPAGTTFFNDAVAMTRAQAEDQMLLLATLHGRYIESPELNSPLSIFATWPDYFARMAPYFEAPCDVGFGLSEEVIPPRLFARRDEIWAATMLSIERHRALPATLTHVDCHLRNWYVTPGGRMGLTDWQGTTRGHWSRDVIYALVTSLAIEDRRAWLDDLLRYYNAHLEEQARRALPLDGLLHEIAGQLPSVLAFWTMTMIVQPGMTEMVQPRDFTLELVRRIAVAMDDLDSLGRLA